MITNLIHGDFYQHWEQLEPVDLILTDPPFGTLKPQEWDKALDWEELGCIFARLLKPTGQAIVFCNFWVMLRLMGTFEKHLQYRTMHAWHKTGGMPINQFSPIPDAEFFLVFRQKGSQVSKLAFNPKVFPGKPYVKVNHQRDQQTRSETKKAIDSSYGGRHIRTVIDAPNKPNMLKAERTSHPTQKPLKLLRPLIRCYSNYGDTVLDPFAGSGSTLIAAHQEGRDSLGFEINQGYYEEAADRIAASIEEPCFELAE